MIPPPLRTLQCVCGCLCTCTVFAGDITVVPFVFLKFSPHSDPLPPSSSAAESRRERERGRECLCCPPPHTHTLSPTYTHTNNYFNIWKLSLFKAALSASCILTVATLCQAPHKAACFPQSCSRAHFK